MSKDLKDTVKDTVKETGEKVEAAVDQGKENFQDLKKKADEHLSNFQQHAEDFAATAEDEFNRLYGEEGKLESLVNFVRDRPILSLGAVGIAIVILTKLFKCCGSKRR